MVILFFFSPVALYSSRVKGDNEAERSWAFCSWGKPPEWGVGFTWSDEAEVPWASVPNPPYLPGRSSGDEAEVPRTSVPYNSPWNLSGVF